MLAGVPPGILALYFLKLRRRPVQVPSTLLWRRSLEDLHVNSLFQRLRKNLLLFLQLLAVLLAMLALSGPRMRGHSSQGQQYILAIDQSASMSATDVLPTRLAKAKHEAAKIIANMQKGDPAMVIAFSDQARVVSSYSANRDFLRSRIDAVDPTQGVTSLREALQVAAGLANPGKQIGEGEVASSIVPPKLFVFTGGGFADFDGFSPGNLVLEVVVIGAPTSAPALPDSDRRKLIPPSNNLAVLSLQAARNEEKPDQFQVFGRVHNYRAEPVATDAKLLTHDPAQPGGQGTLIDALALKLGPQSDQSFKFDLPDQGADELEVRLDIKDDLPLDNRAYAVFGNPRKARVLLVSSGDRYLAGTLKTETAAQLADVTVITPEQAEGDPYLRDAAAGRYDLVIYYDRVRPKTSPEANTLSFGSFPPGKAFDKAKDVEGPVILDWNLAHPLTQYIRDLSLVLIGKAQIVEPPTGSTVLIESNKGPLAFVVPTLRVRRRGRHLPLDRGQVVQLRLAAPAQLPFVHLQQPQGPGQRS